MIITTELN